MGTWALHTVHPPKWAGGGKVEGERRVRRKGQERFIDRRWRAGTGAIRTQASRQSSQATYVRCARHSSHPSGSGEAALVNNFTSTWERC